MEYDARNFERFYLPNKHISIEKGTKNMVNPNAGFPHAKRN